MSERKKTNWYSVLHKFVGPTLAEYGFQRKSTNHYIRLSGPLVYGVRFDTMRSLDPYWGGRVRPEYFVTSLPIQELLKPFTKFSNVKKYAWPQHEFRQFCSLCHLSREDLKKQYHSQLPMYWQLGHGEWYDFNLGEMARATIDFGEPYFAIRKTSYDVFSECIEKVDNGFFQRRLIPYQDWDENDEQVTKYKYMEYVGRRSIRNVCLALTYLEGDPKMCKHVMEQTPINNEDDENFDIYFKARLKSEGLL